MEASVNTSSNAGSLVICHISISGGSLRDPSGH